jgi:hypothetical protein
MGAGLVKETGAVIPQQGRIGYALKRLGATIAPAWSNNAIIIDSAYAYHLPEDISPVALWMVRMGQGPYHSIYNPKPKDPNFDPLVDALYRKGQCAIGAYVVIDPRYWNRWKFPDIIDRYMGWMAAALDYKVSQDLTRKAINCVVFDFEIKYCDGVQMTDSNLFHDLPLLVNACRKRWPWVIFIVYFNGDMLFTPGLCPSLLPWMNDNDDLWTWGAKWCYSHLVNYPTMVAYAKVLPTALYSPLKLFPSNHWNMAQFGGDNGTVVGVTNQATGALTALDISIHNGAKETLWKQLGFIPGVLPPPPPPPHVFTIDERVDQLETFAKGLGYTGPK